MHHVQVAVCCSQSHSVAAYFSLLCSVQTPTSLHLPVQRRRNEVAVCRVPHWWPRRWLCLVYFCKSKYGPCPCWKWTHMYTSSSSLCCYRLCLPLKFTHRVSVFVLVRDPWQSAKANSRAYLHLNNYPPTPHTCARTLWDTCTCYSTQKIQTSSVFSAPVDL